MNPFLRQVAQHYLAQSEQSSSTELPSLDELCFVFPNRRSLLFFQNYLKQMAVRPILAPQMLTINDFLYKIAGALPTDRVSLLLRLYDCYKDLNPQAESLDDFIFWGDTLLGDFSDVDKYLCEADAIFSNISEFRDIESGFEFLNEQQRKALEQFMGHFALQNAQSQAKANFKKIWDILAPLYKQFNQRLQLEGMSYEGKVYRGAYQCFQNQAAVDILLEKLPERKKLVFVGLNMLTPCEKAILKKLQKAHLAEFCWDFPGKWIADDDNNSSFLKENIEEFRPAFSIEQVETTPQIHVLPIPSNVGQTRQIPAIWNKLGIEKLSLESCALVLPDENLLMPVLNAIPPSVESINVTMGYPMKHSEFFSFMQTVLAMQLNISLTQDKGANYYHKTVWPLFASSVFKLLIGEPERERINAIKKEAGYYISQSQLEPISSLLFRPVLTDTQASDAQQLHHLAAYLREVVLGVAPKLSANPALAFESGFAKSYLAALHQLEEKNLSIKPASFVRLLANLTANLSIPFEGEPLQGLQVMGPLESRCLDFENLVIFSCGEGVFPRKSVSASFIPAELRLGFGLPTYHQQDAMWAYYFYRMIARARQVWLLYDSRTEGLQRGEESRFIKQLHYHFNADIQWWTESLSPEGSREEEEIVVEKTGEMMEKINARVMSASSLSSYIFCPMKFYYAKIEEISAPSEVSEYLDGGMLGDVLHNTMRALYHSEDMMYADVDPARLHSRDWSSVEGKLVERAYLENWLKREKEIKWKVDSLIRHKLNVSKVKGRNIIMSKVIVGYVQNVLRADLAYLKEHGATAFRLVELEKRFPSNFAGMNFTGIIDRIDEVVGGDVPYKYRIVDYKTGSDDPSCLTMKNVVKIMTDYKMKAAIQFLLYDYAFCQEKPEVKIKDLCNTMYVPYALSSQNIPQDYPIDNDGYTELSQKVKETLEELKDPAKPFIAKADKNKCAICDFKNLCGKV